MSKLDLRSFQQEISERLAAAKKSGGEVPRLCFNAGSGRYALPLAEITEVAPLAAVRKIPGTAPWFLGLTNVRGAVIALTHLGAVVGFDAVLHIQLRGGKEAGVVDEVGEESLEGAGDHGLE